MAAVSTPVMVAAFWVIVAIVVVLVIVFVVNPSPASSSQSPGANLVIQQHSSSQSRALMSEVCLAPTDEQQQEMWLPHNALVCSSLPTDLGIRSRDFHYRGKHFPPENGEPLYVFEPRHETDFVVEMDNVNGMFYGAYLTFEPDMWSEGFSPQGRTPADVTAMVANLQTAVPLFGSEVVVSGTECTPAFAFDVSNPITNSMSSLSSTSVSRLQEVSSDHMKGVLRMSFDHVDYHYHLGDTECSVRVLLGNCGGFMGDKLLRVDGEFKWFDKRQQTFVSVRNDDCLSFWNQNDDEKEEDPEDVHRQAFQEALIQAFVDQHLGMPMDLEGADGTNTVDFRELATSSQMTLDVTIDGWIAFERADEDSGSTDTAEWLLANPAEHLRRFEIPDLSLKAMVSFVADGGGNPNENDVIH